MNDQRDIGDAKLVRVSFSREELVEVCRHLCVRCLPGVRLSTLFLMQLVQGASRRVLFVRQVMATIEGLIKPDQPTVTPPPKEFKHPPLVGLRKAHFFQPPFILRNLGAYWGLEHGGNARLEELLKDFVHEHEGEELDDRLASLFAHKLVIEGYERRSSEQGLTGEWIVFNTKHETIDILSLASHTETNEEIHSRIVAHCGADYSELES